MALGALGVGTSILYQLLNPGWVAFRDGVQAMDRGDDSRAAELFHRAARSGDKIPLLEEKLGFLYLSRGEFAEAAAALEIALQRDPASVPTIDALAGIYQHLDQPERALHVYLHAIEGGAAFPPQLSLRLADLFRQLQLYPEAEAAYRDLLARRAPGSDRIARTAALHLAEQLAWRREYEDAIRLLESIIEQHPDDRPARLALARTLTWAGRTRDAIFHYRQLLDP